MKNILIFLTFGAACWMSYTVGFNKGQKACPQSSFIVSSPIIFDSTFNQLHNCKIMTTADYKYKSVVKNEADSMFMSNNLVILNPHFVIDTVLEKDIQRVIDSVWEGGGGTVYLPNNIPVLYDSTGGLLK